MKAVLNGMGRRNETVFRPRLLRVRSEHQGLRLRSRKSQAATRRGRISERLSSRLPDQRAGDRQGLEIAQAVAGQLDAVGVHATVNNVSLATFRSVVVGGQSQKKNEGLFLTNYGSSLADPNIALEGFLSTTGVDSFYSNPTFDAMMKSADSSMTLDARKKIYHDEQVFLKDEAPAIFLFQAPDIWGVNNRLVWKARLDQNVLGTDMSVKSY